MPKKTDKYKEERIEILNRLLEILEITKENKMISLSEMDSDVKKQELIYGLEIEIKRVFVCSRWSYFNNRHREGARKYLSLIKCLLKAMEIKIETFTKRVSYDKIETYYEINI